MKVPFFCVLVQDKQLNNPRIKMNAILITLVQHLEYLIIESLPISDTPAIAWCTHFGFFQVRLASPSP